MTVKSLLSEIPDADKNDITIFIYVADFDESYQDRIVQYFKDNYNDLLSSGVILLRVADQNKYPKLDGLYRTYNDPEVRVQWRAKQVVDYAIMFKYAEPLSKYYLQIEDDVTAASDWLKKIKDDIAKQKLAWSSLEFSTLGFIGKLLKNEDLKRMSEFLHLFYDRQPVDWLYPYFIKLMANKRVPVRKPTLFQHKGQISSLKTKKKRNSLDKYFDMPIRGTKRNNPPAKTCTSMSVHGRYKPANVYDDNNSSDLFWAVSPKAGEHYSIYFSKPLNISEVMIYSGHPEKETDFIDKALLEFGYQETNDTSMCQCKLYKAVWKFSGECRKPFQKSEISIANNVQCIRIRITADHKHWVIINDIRVTTH